MVKKKKKVSVKNKVKQAGKVKKAGAVKFKKLPKTELNKFKELLLRQRSMTGGDLSHIAQNTLNKSQRDATGSLSGYSYHMADMASDDYERDFSLDRATEEQKVLYLVDEAIKRVEDGSYGACLECGCQITKKRLMVMPYARFCIQCQEKLENK